MMDLERELRDLFRRRAEVAHDRSVTSLATEVTRRVRRRQLRTAALTGLGAGLVAAAIFGGARLVTEERPSPEPGGPRQDVDEVGGAVMVPVISGEYQGVPFGVTVRRRAGLWCLGIRGPVEEQESCEPAIARADLTARVAFHSGDPFAIVAGSASAGVDRVVLRGEGSGQREIALISPGQVDRPELADAPFRVFAAVIDVREATSFVGVEGVDRDGKVLVTRGFTAPIRGFQPVRDVFDNVVGSVPIDRSGGGTGWVEPGDQGASIDEIRRMSQIALVDVWPRVRRWWGVRPFPDDHDGALRLWWGNYPVDQG